VTSVRPGPESADVDVQRGAVSTNVEDGEPLKSRRDRRLDVGISRGCPPLMDELHCTEVHASVYELNALKSAQL
jgi:hypothetical protein